MCCPDRCLPVSRLSLPRQCGKILTEKGGEIMFLIKCKCGCFFTLKKESLTLDFYQCLNCKNNIPVSAYTLDMNNPDLASKTQSISYIPDNAKITVAFDV